MRTVSRIFLATLLLSGATNAMAQDVVQRTERLDDGTFLTVHEIIVPATSKEVWESLTTSEGVMSWAVPFAHVDFRLNGIWESSYDLNAQRGSPSNIKNKFISYIPERMMAMQAVQAPPSFQHREVLDELFSVFELEALGESETRVTVYGVGYRDTPEMNEVRAFFERGNAWSMQKLYERFAEGPVDWESEIGGGG